MCGIAGLLGGSDETLVRRMTGALAHRGPDGDGFWSDAEAGVALGHRRLAVIDLSEQGHQPMVSATGRFVLVFNGELYNYLEVRADLAVDWRGHSDTEVLLAAIEAWGLERAIDRLEGQFAFALWDRQARTLTLVRDRFGEKPLYWGRLGPDWVFGSELKALSAHPGFDRRVDPEALASYLRFATVPAPRSIYRGLNKLQPGHLVVLRADAATAEPAPYWRLETAVAASQNAPFGGSEAAALEALDALLGRTVRSRMIADVPLGSMLSGGIDSSLITAVMQGQSSAPVRTFTVGTEDRATNEADHARQVAKALGTEHTEIVVSSADIREVIPDLPRMNDEPFAADSQIPVHLISKLARQSVTVALSGDGGDELFGGYNRYFYGRSLWRRARSLPPAMRAALSGALLSAPPGLLNTAFAAMGPLAPAELRHGAAGEKIHKLASVLGARDEADFHQRLLSIWPDPASLMREPATGLVLPGGHPIPTGLTDFAERAMFLDAAYYLPDSVLSKVDRASMACSLEVRAPFLDREVFGFAWGLPLDLKMRGGRGKHLLRELLGRYLPPALFERPKQGFTVPTGAWLRAELKPWAEDLLSTDSLNASGLLNPEPIRKVWAEHLSRRRNWDARLWTLLMFQAWWFEGRGAA